VIRPFLLVVAALILSAAATAWAQQRATVPVVGVLRTSSFVANDPSTEALKRALSEFGYVEGQNIKLVRRFAEGQLDRLPQLAQDLVQLKVDVIPAPNHAAVRAAKQATTTIPVVMVLYDYDPVALRTTPTRSWSLLCRRRCRMCSAASTRCSRRTTPKPSRPTT